MPSGGGACARAVAVEDVERLIGEEHALFPAALAAELEVVRAYEASGRGRRTILAKVDQLLAGDAA